VLQGLPRFEGGHARHRHPSPPWPPGVELRGNLESISHRCYLSEVSFAGELTKATIYLPLGRLDGWHGRPSSAYMAAMLVPFTPHSHLALTLSPHKGGLRDSSKERSESELARLVNQRGRGGTIQRTQVHPDEYSS
jgi:hypothetical protein